MFIKVDQAIGENNMHPLLIGMSLWTLTGAMYTLGEVNGNPSLVAAAVAATVTSLPYIIKALARWRDQEAVEAVEHKIVAETASKQAMHNLDTIESQTGKIGHLEGQIKDLIREQGKLRQLNHAVASAAQAIVSHVDLSRTITIRLLKEHGMTEADIQRALPEPPPMTELIALLSQNPS